MCKRKIQVLKVQNQKWCHTAPPSLETVYGLSESVQSNHDLTKATTSGWSDLELMLEASEVSRPYAVDSVDSWLCPAEAGRPNNHKEQVLQDFVGVTGTLAAGPSHSHS